jgi:hypothetical protein
LVIKSRVLLPSILTLCFLIVPLLNNGLGSLEPEPVYSQGQNVSDTSSSSLFSSFQSKAAILDNMPSHNVTVGDINIAYKQIGKADAKPIILITGGGATMDIDSDARLGDAAEMMIRKTYAD